MLTDWHATIPNIACPISASLHNNPKLLNCEIAQPHWLGTAKRGSGGIERLEAIKTSVGHDYFNFCFAVFGRVLLQDLQTGQAQRMMQDTFKISPASQL